MERLQEMISVLLVATEKESLADLQTGFEKNGAAMTWAPSYEEVQAALKQNNFDLIIIDEEVSGLNGLKCLERLILFNPLLNCAAVSSLSHGDFHEASEGMGVLMQLPSRPGAEEAVKLLEHLQKILNLS